MSTTITEAKAALRRAWKNWPEPDWAPLTARFLALPQVEEARVLMLFYGVGREPDTVPLIETLLQRGKTVVLPRCLQGRRMEARQVPAAGVSALRPGAYGIPEPDERCPLVEKGEVDLVLTPNLCCDRLGYRLGHGGGYYDRWLADYTGITVALCPQIWLQETLPRDGFDRPVDVVITE